MALFVLKSRSFGGILTGGIIFVALEGSIVGAKAITLSHEAHQTIDGRRSYISVADIIPLTHSWSQPSNL